jgi:hypothetical protein
MITRNTQVEEIVKIPGIISYLIEHGVSPITCDGAFPQTIGRLLEIRKTPDPEGFINSLNTYLGERTIAVDGSPD